MPQLAGHPLGIAFLTALLVAHGLAALGAAFEIANRSASSGLNTVLILIGVPSAIASAAAGLFLLRRAYMLWNYRPGAWWVTLAASCVSEVSAMLAVAVAPRSVGPWIQLVAATVTVLYLVQPRVRALFR